MLSGLSISIPDVFEFVEMTRSVVEDVKAIVAVVKPGRRQSVWKAFEEHTTNGSQLSQS